MMASQPFETVMQSYFSASWEIALIADCCSLVEIALDVFFLKLWADVVKVAKPAMIAAMIVNMMRVVCGVWCGK